MMAGAAPFRLGIDLGSTTIKVVAEARDSGACIWRHYARHETQVAGRLLACLVRLERDTGITAGNCVVSATGSAAAALAPAIGARFVQDVPAISLAVEKMHPGVESVIELGGQDAKIVVFRDGDGGARKKLPSMNDKCAGGTGAVIDKIAAKLNMSAADLERQPYAGVRLHPVAGKCGVFAETDITGLLKRGVPAGELMASLFDALVLQNLSVLTRGYTLHPQVLLLGGPNAFLRGLREAWQQRIPETWRERGIDIPPPEQIERVIFAPPYAHLYGALGALEFGRLEGDDEGRYRGHEPLEALINERQREGRRRPALPALVRSAEERDAFVRTYAPPAFVPPVFERGERVPVYLGLDAGSTSTKGVLLSPAGAVIAKAYRLSLGNPIEDAMGIIASLRQSVEEAGGSAEVLGAATTGYAKDILRDVLCADVAIAETVAHTESAKQLYRDPHVIVDVGGQDIKLIVLKDGRVKDFRLNTQCSAGNGYFLHATAESFGIPVERYADAAFTARVMPLFGYGCAVFLQSDIGTFQRHGWTREEILAGLAAVLPKNVFLYVARVANLARLGRRFILQGGTQRNLAVVKAEVDFIRESFARSGCEPEIIVHEHAGECGAIGAALEAMRVLADGRASTFIGMDAAARIHYGTTSGPETRCTFCRNRCERTFIDVTTGGATRRVVSASCERGAQIDVAALRAADAAARAARGDCPDFVEIASREVWLSQHPDPASSAAGSRRWPRLSGPEPIRPRAQIRVGIPRVLNLYSYAPLFSAYLESLGVLPQHIVYSDVTSGELYRTGSSRGSIDPCFPSKVALAHVHNLLAVKHRRAPLDCIFFPMFDVLDSPLVATRGQYACPTVAATPRTVKAAFTKEHDAFGEAGILYLDPLLNLANRPLLALQMYDAWAPVLGLTRRENAAALEAGFAAMDGFWTRLRARARAALDRLERDDRIGIVVLGRPYHHDPGINHGILAELHKRGYPIFSQGALPRDPDLLERLFGDEVRAGVIAHALDISDVWKHTTSENTNQKIWAAKFVARHPNLVALEFSSFKCGHDAPVYSVIESIVEAAGRPYLGFKDLDENRAVGAVKLRIETMDYFLKRYAQDVRARQERLRDIEERLAHFERRVRRRLDRARQARQAFAGRSA